MVVDRHPGVEPVAPAERVDDQVIGHPVAGEVGQVQLAGGYDGTVCIDSR